MTWRGPRGRYRRLAGRGGRRQPARRCATELALLAKQTGITVLIVGHVTKDGQLAGPKLLEHLVDVVLAFEAIGTTATGSPGGEEPVRFDPRDRPLPDDRRRAGIDGEHSVHFDEDERLPGAAIVPTLAGSRCLLAEIQALSATGFLGSAKRRASGLDAARLAMLIAVLEKHGGLRLADQDVFVSVAGGLHPGTGGGSRRGPHRGVHAGRALPPRPRSSGS